MPPFTARSSALQSDVCLLTMSENETLIIRNEFAAVQISYLGEQPVKALVLTDINSGKSVSLDALDLEVLTRVDKDKLRSLIPQ